MGSLWSFPGFGIIISASCQKHGIFPDIQIKLKILRSIFLVKGDVDSLKIGSEFYLVQQLCHGIFFFLNGSLLAALRQCTLPTQGSCLGPVHTKMNVQSKNKC